jgi:hypothetical protein
MESRKKEEGEETDLSFRNLQPLIADFSVFRIDKLKLPFRKGK